LDGSDATNPDPDYSAAYLELRTSGSESGFGFVFTIGRGNEVQVAAIRALELRLLGREVDEVLADLGGISPGGKSIDAAYAQARRPRPSRHS
jgi:L-fuconate dehydratase